MNSLVRGTYLPIGYLIDRARQNAVSGFEVFGDYQRRRRQYSAAMERGDPTADGDDDSAREAAGGGGYSIRAGGPGDREAFLSLYEAVWGRSKSAAWFDWRFVDNPFTDRVELVVAERAGRVVGAEPLLALPL